VAEQLLASEGFSFIRPVNSTCTLPASYPMSTGDFFLWGKATGNEADHPTSFKAKVKNVWSYSSTPSCLYGMVQNFKHRNIAFPCFFF
jgi:hypothetical protein